MEVKSLLLGFFSIFFCGIAPAGVFKDETDRFSGSRSVGWIAVPVEDGAFSLSTFAFYPKDAEVPSAYILDLLTWTKGSGYGNCHHAYWMLDGKPLEQEFEYHVTPSESELIEHFSLSTDRNTIERFAKAKKIEFKVCSTESKLTAADKNGLRRVLSKTSDK